PDDLRLIYARHLMTFALAMKDPAHTDIIPTVCAQNREVADAVFAQLEAAAAKADTSQAVFDIVEEWLLHPPLGVDVDRWRPLLGLALQTRHAALMQSNDTAGLFELMDRLVESSALLGIERSIVQIISSSYQKAYNDGRLASKIFMLAIAHLPIAGLQRIFSDPKYMAQLPAPLTEAVSALNGTLRQPRPEVLRRASASFGQETQPLILGRLVEWAYSGQRFDLLDTTALKGMINVAASVQGTRFDPLIVSLAQDLSRPDVIRRLPNDAPPYLIAMQLARGRYQEAVNTLQFYQDNLFKATEQWQLAEIARIGLREAPLGSRQLLPVLEVINNSQLRTLIKLSAFVGALDSQKWSAAMEPAMRGLANYWVNDPRLIAMLGVEPVLRLLQATAARKDRPEALRLVGAIVEFALALGSEAEGTTIPELFAQVYAIAGWSPEMVTAITTSISVFIRRAPLDVSSQLTDEMGEKQGATLTAPMFAALRARQVLGGDNFIEFAQALEITAELLIDFAAVYHESQEPPPLFKLRRNVQGAPGGMTEQEKRQLGENFQRLAVQIMALFSHQQTRNLKRSRQDTDQMRTRLFNANAAPTTGLEALWWLGGYFSQGQQIELNLVREAQPHLFGIRTLNILVRETEIAIDTLRGLLSAFQDRDDRSLPTPEVEAQAWAAEIGTVWAMLTLPEQRQVQDQIGSDAQLLMRVVQAIGAKGNEKALQDSGPGRQLYTGKQQPRSVIDVLRWLAGYFLNAHE
ncbi:MAG: hypothetical protein KF726_22465, partial [Anaerolineae bacterium]|nr:hypothetical protein [Anaerolineae bacterium]